MRFPILLGLIVVLSTTSFSQNSADLIKSNHVKSCKVYVTDSSGISYSYVKDSLYYYIEYDRSGNMIKEDNLISYLDTEIGIEVPFINYWIYNTENKLIESYAISKDYYLGEKLREGGDTNFHFNYSYEKDYTSKESVNHVDTSLYYNYYLPGSKTITKWRTVNSIVVRNKIYPDTLETIYTTIIDLNQEGDTTNTSKGVNKTAINYAISQDIIDSISQVYPSFDSKLYTIEKRTSLPKEKNGYKKIRISFYNKKNQICYHLFASGKNPKIYIIDKYSYLNNGLCDNILSRYFMGIEKYLKKSYVYKY